ncbi:MAG: peptidoglycan DD-metalloendopeptidase family protein [Coxiellaceae bacterium]|jgi:septal ring factor EnvC (AmiA/AmiB activator)|nr:peptidoglycan DD-metalloendopeptidase family protein [Coxiellaceae bacterium]
MQNYIAIIIGIMMFLSTCFPPLVFGNNNANELDSVLYQINNIKNDIAQKRKQQSSVKQQLNILRKKISLLEVSYKKTIENLQNQRKILIKLSGEQLYKQNELKKVQNKLTDQIRLMYLIQQDQYLKIIVMGNEAITPRVISTYHEYVFMAHFSEMHDIREAFENLEQNKIKIKLETLNLEKIKKKQVIQKQELSKVREEHKKILNLLQNNIASQNKRLNNLLLAKRNLEELISRIIPRTKVAAPVSSHVWSHKSFIWPTPGVIITHFGNSIEQSSWRWNGIIIRAPEGQEVRAISSGRIIYAGWLSGYGALLIIDHGNGYMSLYGYNKSCFKKLNDKVYSGEVISTVGKSDSDEPGLYFAIRYHGKPINPENLQNKI